MDTFLERVKGHQMDAKERLHQQVDTIVDDYFAQLVREFTDILRGDRVPLVALKQLLTRRTVEPIVETVICEPNIDLSLFNDRLGCGEHLSMHSLGNGGNSTFQGEYFKEDEEEEEDSSTGASEISDAPEDLSIKHEKISESEGEDATLGAPAEMRTFPGSVAKCSPSLSLTAPNPTPWYCCQCSKEMKNERTLYMHKWRYHKVGQFKCRHGGCDFIASYRIQLRTHHIKCHDMGKFICPFPGCGRSFNRRNSLKRHERIHLRLKPYRCKWPSCEYACELRSSMIDHVRVTHFRLPRSRREQQVLQIGDDRNPSDYFEVISEGLDLLEPVLEHVNLFLGQHQQQQQERNSHLSLDSHPIT